MLAMLLAMDDEMASLWKNKIWILVEAADGQTLFKQVGV